MKLQPVTEAAAAVLIDLQRIGFTAGEINMILSIAKQTIKKDRQ